ncbi:MAG TPA: hypothetical protein VIV60_33450, partial [Polyangiaceae bacterium]
WHRTMNLFREMLQIDSGPSQGDKGGRTRPLAATMMAALPGIVAFLTFVFQSIKFCRDTHAFVDDPFISMRFAANLVEHGELAFNLGTRVEGYSNLLHVLIHALVFRLHVGIPDAARAIDGAVICVFLVTLMQFLVLARLSRIAEHRLESTAYYYALLLTMVGMPVAFWATAGLETPIEALLYLCVALAARRFGQWSLWRAATVVSLMMAIILVRFEGIIMAGVIVAAIAWVLVRSGQKRVAIGVLASVGISGSAYHLWRMMYFGHLLPNTYVAKATGGSFVHQINSGAHYCGNWLALLGGGLAVVALLLAVLSKRSRMVGTGDAPAMGSTWTPNMILASAVVIAKLALVTVGGGDWMPGFRMLVPVGPFALFLVVRLLLDGGRGAALVKPRGVAAVALALALPFVARGVPFPLGWGDSAAGSLKSLPAGYVEMGGLLAERFHGGNAEVAIGEAGLIPFVARDTRFLDMFGLVDADMARQPGGMHRRVHVKHLLERRPQAIVFAHLSADPPFGPYQYGPELLDSRQFHDCYRRVTVSSSLDRTGWALYVRSDVDIATSKLEWASQDPLRISASNE